MSTFSEKITIGLGGIGILILLVAVITALFDVFQDGQSIMLAFIQLLLVFLASPFLWHITNSYEHISIWFKNYIIIESLLNSILMPFVSVTVTPNLGYVFFIFAVLELIPLLLLFSKRYKFGESGYKSKYRSQG